MQSASGEQLSVVSSRLSVSRTPLAEAVDSDLHYSTGGDTNWQRATGANYHDEDCAVGTAWDDGESWMETEVEGAGTLKFLWKVSSEANSDYLEFYVDDVLKRYISGTPENWAEVSLEVAGSTTHTLKWRYVKDDNESSAGDDCGYVDWVRWSGGPGQEPDPDAWTRLTYVYDPAGRRIEKKYDGQTVLKYIYDGDHCIAEYDVYGGLHRKYIFGPAVDEPICMIETTGAQAGTYYYHFDAQGSVVALTNSSGNTVQAYDYDVYGRVAAAVDHPNRFLFTGREFDQETGLYYYRARYYNPQIGRFLQTDPIGYASGMNMYGYCGNSPIGWTDPSGLRSFDPLPGYYYTCEWTFPATAIALEIVSDDQAFAASKMFFNDRWTGWDVGWRVESSHLEENGDVHTRFVWQNYFRGGDLPAPTAPNLAWQNVSDDCQEPVVLLNGVGLLEQWKLDRILAFSKERVDGWWVWNPLIPHSGMTLWEAYNLVYKGDTAFFDTSIAQWEFGGTVYDRSELNFYLEGYAMRHYCYTWTYAASVVFGWENLQGQLASLYRHRSLGPLRGPQTLANVLFWFTKGWDEHGYPYKI